MSERTNQPTDGQPPSCVCISMHDRRVSAAAATAAATIATELFTNGRFAFKAEREMEHDRDVLPKACALGAQRRRDGCAAETAMQADTHGTQVSGLVAWLAARQANRSIHNNDTDKLCIREDRSIIRQRSHFTLNIATIGVLCHLEQRKQHSDVVYE